MSAKRYPDIARRYKGNPIITIADLSFPCGDICNAGAVKIGGEDILLLTVQGLDGTYAIFPARSSNGLDFEVSDTPFLAPSREGPFEVYEKMGVLDARITRLEGEYFISYDAMGQHGYRLGLARTSDFRSVERVGLISEPDTKGGVLFPVKVKGRYARLERPWAGSSIWISYSEDLRFWGWSEVLMTPRGGFWDNTRIGTATPPMETDQGWLVIYYGIRQTAAGPLFRLAAAVREKEDPAQVRGYTAIPIPSQRETYERIGDVPHLVFSCGAIIEPDNEIKLYYGAANACICLGTTGLENIMRACMEHGRDF